MKLSPEQKELLREIGHQEGYPLLHALLESLVQLKEQDVLRHDLNNSNLQELAIKKARAEGARRLAGDFKTALEKILSTGDQ